VEDSNELLAFVGQEFLSIDVAVCLACGHEPCPRSNWTERHTLVEAAIRKDLEVIPVTYDWRSPLQGVVHKVHDEGVRQADLIAWLRGPAPTFGQRYLAAVDSLAAEPTDDDKLGREAKAWAACKQEHPELITNSTRFRFLKGRDPNLFDMTEKTFIKNHLPKVNARNKH
jgi:hypothetical protein